MKKSIIGFIGAGNMGGILAERICSYSGAENVTVCCSTEKHSAETAKRLGCTFSSAETIASECKYVFLGIKPQMLSEVVSPLKRIFDERKDDYAIVSMLAGVSIEKLKEVCGDHPIIRIMPNTPAKTGEGMTLICPSLDVMLDVLSDFDEMMRCCGKTDIITEKYFDAAACITGCGPAFAYMFVEALADGGVKCGLPRDKAQIYAAQMLKGAADLVLKTGEHPGRLKDNVCSPAGTTIAGVEALEKNAFRASVMQSVDAAYKRTKELSK